MDYLQEPYATEKDVAESLLADAQFLLDNLPSNQARVENWEDPELTEFLRMGEWPPMNTVSSGNQQRAEAVALQGRSSIADVFLAGCKTAGGGVLVPSIASHSRTVTVCRMRSAHFIRHASYLIQPTQSRSGITANRIKTGRRIMGAPHVRAGNGPARN